MSVLKSLSFVAAVVPRVSLALNASEEPKGARASSLEGPSPVAGFPTYTPLPTSSERSRILEREASREVSF